MARADAGLTISELAQRAGVSRDTISNAEKGRHGLQATTLHKVARALGKTPSELLAEEERLTPKVESRSSLEPSFEDALEEERRIDFAACAGALDYFSGYWWGAVTERRTLDRQQLLDFLTAIQGIAPMVVELSRAEREQLGVRGKWTEADRKRSALWPSVLRFVRVAFAVGELAGEADKDAAASALADALQPLAA